MRNACSRGYVRSLGFRGALPTLRLDWQSLGHPSRALPGWGRERPLPQPGTEARTEDGALVGVSASPMSPSGLEVP